MTNRSQEMVAVTLPEKRAKSLKINLACGGVVVDVCDRGVQVWKGNVAFACAEKSLKTC